MGHIIKPPLGATLNTSDPLSQGLVGCWLMNEGGGLKVNDLSEKGNHGTLVNGTSWVAGNDGKALSFNRTNNNYVSIPKYTKITQKITMFVKFKQPSTAITGQFISLNGHECRLRTDSNKVTFIADGAAIILSSNFTLVNNNYYTVALVANPYPSIYINGVLDKTGLTAYSGNNTGYNNYIGAFGPGTELYNGIISDVRIWNRALSANEVKDLYVTPYRNIIFPKRRFYSISSTPTVNTTNFFHFMGA